ncbi:hypothetical protein [Brevundimonas sp.]|uniref:hypothetical protein n=1 Tax=Brevundimonas sp. TaxID=1871086 RepID=UPI0037C066AA
MKTAQIGAAGVLLLQYCLLKSGIDSSAMTTDDGIDVVAYSPQLRDAVTIQVKTVLAPKKAGGRGKLTLDWWLRHNSPAQLVALCDLSTDRIWIFRHEEYLAKAQQNSSGRAHLYFYVDAKAKAPEHSKEPFFEPFLIDRRVTELFGSPDVAA